MLGKLVSTYKNNPIGTVGGVLFGHYVAKQMGYNKEISVISFMIVGSIFGASIEHMIKAKRSQPTAEIIKS